MWPSTSRMSAEKFPVRLIIGPTGIVSSTGETRIEDFQMWKNYLASGLFFLGAVFSGIHSVQAMELGGDPRLPKSVPTLHAASYFATCILNGKLTSGVAFHESDWWHDRLSDVTFDYSPSPTNPPVGFFSFNIARSGPFAPGDQIVLFSTQNSSTVAATRITVTVTADDLAFGDATFQRNCVTTKVKRGEAAARHDQIVQQGAGEFHAWCSRCHGSTGRGDGPFARNLKKKPLDLTQLAVRNGGDFPTGLVRRLVDGRGMPRAHGAPEMPVWGVWFSDQMTSGGVQTQEESELQKLIKQRIDRIVSYLEAIQDP